MVRTNQTQNKKISWEGIYVVPQVFPERNLWLSYHSLPYQVTGLYYEEPRYHHGHGIQCFPLQRFYFRKKSFSPVRQFCIWRYGTLCLILSSMTHLSLSLSLILLLLTFWLAFWGQLSTSCFWHYVLSELAFAVDSSPQLRSLQCRHVISTVSFIPNSFTSSHRRNAKGLPHF